MNVFGEKVRVREKSFLVGGDLFTSFFPMIEVNGKYVCIKDDSYTTGMMNAPTRYRAKKLGDEFIKSKGVSSMKKKDKFTIKFYTQKEFCHCCDRELDEAELSEMREFDFYAEQLQEDIDWKLYDESELEEVVLGYVFDTFEFFAVKTYDNMVLFEGEVDRMIEYVKENFM